MLTRAQAKELLLSIDELQMAIGRAASHFDETIDAGRWQQSLLHASKKVTRTTDEHLRAPFEAAKAAYERMSPSQPE